MSQTNDPQLPPTPQSLTVDDIYYVLFRNKWKILICSLTGVLAAALVYRLSPPPYTSEAKLFIRYVLTEGKTQGPTGDNSATVTSPDQGGETIMDSELEILSSLDLARQVAQVVGPETILAKVVGAHDLNHAANVVKAGLTVEVPPKTSVIHLTFKNRDPAILQPVLGEVIESYLKMHVDIHRPVGIVGDFLNQETEQLRAQLAQTEEDLREADTKAGISSPEEATKTYDEELARIQQEIFDTQAELAERTAVVQGTGGRIPSPTPLGGANPQVPAEQVDTYRALSSRLELLRKNEQEMLTQFTVQNIRVKDIQAQIAETISSKAKLEEQYPTLAAIGPVATVQGPPATTTATHEADGVPPAALQSKIKMLNSQLDEVHAKFAKLEQMQGTIAELQRRKDLEEANYRYFSARLEQSRINEALGTGRVSNISEIQAPSPPYRDQQKLLKILAGIVVTGVVSGLAWAFLIELVFDRSVKRPVDIEKIVGLPLFLSIPMIGRREQKALLKTAGALPDGSPTSGTLSKLLPWQNSVALQPFHETLRDRLIGFFESINLTHKPKLIAVTGLGQGSGVTTTAAGLARSLSDTRDSNVLLVDMTVGQGSAQEFYKGKQVCALEEIFSVRESALVQEKLYVVAEEPGTNRLSRILPQRFSKLVPKLKASDFDYIIFDMPAVSQLSITPRLAGFMDMVMLVVESEKTDQDVVKRATALLEKSNARVGVVLNKTRAYVPKRLNQHQIGNV